MPTPVATAERPVLETSPATATEPYCTACPHPADAHDTVGLRFCRATVASGLDRGCVCRLG